MLGNFDTRTCADLRKKSSIRDDIRYSGLDINVCMMVFAVIGIFLYVIFSIVAQNPVYLF